MIAPVKLPPSRLLWKRSQLRAEKVENVFTLQNKQVLVIGLNPAGRAACRLLHAKGAQVTALDRLDIPDLREAAQELRALGISVHLGVVDIPPRIFDLAVVGPEVAESSTLVRSLRQADIPVIGDVELAFQQASCLTIGISGTNGKTTAGQLIGHMLAHCHRKTVVADGTATLISDAVQNSRDLDFLTVETNVFQLERIQFFRPSVAVLLNIGHDHLDRFPKHSDYVRNKSRLFMNQQAFDWAIVQSEAWAQMRALNLPMPGKAITFSAQNRRADIFLDRSLLVSRIEGWEGPLLDMDHCQLRGPHQAENLMAALAVGRVLRLPLDEMVEALKNFAPLPHRGEVVAEINGVKYVNDAKAVNLEALRSALLSFAGDQAEPNIWLIAGGKDRGVDYHELGPLLSERVKGTFLIGEMREKLRAAWSLFTPCMLAGSLLEAVSQAAEKAASGDIVLLSPACSSFDQFQNYQHRGELFRQAVHGLSRTTDGGSDKMKHHMQPNLGRAEMSRPSEN